MRWPTISAVLKDLVSVRDQAVDYGEDLEDGTIEVRLQVMSGGAWYIHTGDPQYDTDHRGFWGAGYVSQSDKVTTLRALARDLIGEAQDHHAQMG